MTGYIARKTTQALGTILLLPFIAGASVITTWNEQALDSIRATSTPPPKASRALAILHTAVYDAVNGVSGNYQPYLVTPAAPAGASQEAAAIVAAHDTLVSLFPSRTAILDAARDTDLGSISDGPSKSAGVTWGAQVAGAILASRSADGSTAVVTYTPGSRPGDWRPTPPAMAPALLPQWGDVATFGVPSAEDYVPGPPPKLSSKQYAKDFILTRDIGSVNSTVRTPDQTLAARFWANGGGTATPPGHWNQIARQLIDLQGVDFEGQARLLALMNVALADAAISCWKTKYAYNYWRPITAIREADTDDNRITGKDATWTPLLVTPPFPEYTSGHSTFSGAAAATLAVFFGTDHIAFTTASDDAPGILRSYNSISEAADESGMSRIYGGIHFMSANEEGLKAGRAIGNYVAKHLLKPVHGEDEDEGSDSEND